METHANEDQEDSIYTGTMPVAKEPNATDEQNVNEEQAVEKKKYHSSAMYAASKWHNTVSHVSHAHKGLEL